MGAHEGEARELTITQQKLQEMFTECTGASIFDSGSTYGRHWQANQGRGFFDEPYQTVKASAYPRRKTDHHLPGDKEHACGCDADPDCPRCEGTGLLPYFVGEFSVNTAQWLDQHLEYVPGTVLCDLWEGFCLQRENGNTSQFRDATDFSEQFEEACAWNTCNSTCVLSQGLEGRSFRAKDTDYVLLMVHGGCDVRGGYTKPVLFELREELDWGYGSIGCDHCGASWYTDDAHNWYSGGPEGDLKNYPASLDPEDRGEGYLVAIDGKLACPCCREGFIV